MLAALPFALFAASEGRHDGKVGHGTTRTVTVLWSFCSVSCHSAVRNLAGSRLELMAADALHR